MSWAEWEVAPAQPGAHPEPSGIDGLDWAPATVPGFTGSDETDWWFRTTFDAAPVASGEQVALAFDGIATVADVFVDGELVAHTESMWEAHAIDVSARVREGGNTLAIRCHALAPLLAVPRKPRARWRTKVADGGLRWWRTMLLGRAPGFAPGPPAVGPWRPPRIERRSGVVLDALALRPRVEPDGSGVLGVRARLCSIAGAAQPATLTVALGSATCELPVRDGVAEGELVIADVALWWPHSHGDPALHDVRVSAGGRELAQRRVGFRTLTTGPEGEVDLHVNGVGVFARGAVWTPVPESELRATLEQMRDGGMNLVRVVGLARYEPPAFHDLCDELGILVWQDFMFANLDYPVSDPDFRVTVEAEARAVLAELAGRPSLAVLCGNSEVEQQVAMLGLDPALGRGELFGELLPGLVAEAGVDAAWIPSAPSGGTLPFRTGVGVANYFGVGGYRRPLADARLAAVRFASECLALANVPDGDALAEAGVPRDVGADWDFADVRDHYLELLYGLDAAQLRAQDPEHYRALSRAVSGEVMAEVFGEWRREGSGCRGAIVLWLRDLLPGAGWGVLDSSGAPKLAWHHLRRALAPVAVWMTDEGMDGIAVHVANDGPETLTARLRVALYRDGELRVEEATEDLALAPHEIAARDLEGMLGRFVDASYAFRFGEPGHDLIVASLELDGVLLSQNVRFPADRPTERESAEALGLSAEADTAPDGSLRVTVRARRYAHGVRVRVPGHAAGEDGFSVEPGGERVITLRQVAGATAGGLATVEALNLAAPVAVAGLPFSA